MSSRYSMTFTALPEQIDELGHVNNAVWLQWVQGAATAHWLADAAPDYVERYVWVVLRHEIDYRGNVGPGETVTAETHVPAGPQGARMPRHVVFRDAAGKVLVEVKSMWALIDRETMRIARIPRDMVAPFLD